MKIERLLFKIKFDGDRRIIPMKSIPNNLLTHDKDYYISIEKEPEFYSENNSYDATTTLRVIEIREETDEEKRIFREEFTKKLEEIKEERRKNYIQLKKEFEP